MTNVILRAFCERHGNRKTCRRTEHLLQVSTAEELQAVVKKLAIWGKKDICPGCKGRVVCALQYPPFDHQ